MYYLGKVRKREIEWEDLLAFLKDYDHNLIKNKFFIVFLYDLSKVLNSRLNEHCWVLVVNFEKKNYLIKLTS